MTTEEKFWSKVDRNSKGCWLWIAGKSDTGYGTFVDSNSKKRLYAHRFSWELHNGSIPKGLYVLHKCDVRACVRPSHLFVGTQKENILDALAKGRLAPQQQTFIRLWRSKWKGVRCGENIHCSKLTSEKVAKIRNLYNPKLGLTCEKLGAMFGVALKTVHDAITRKTWKHIK